MYYDVKSAEYASDYKIKITFKDGKSGAMDFQKYLHRGGVFEKFHDINFFKNFLINDELGVLCWPGDIDVAPETLYFEVTKTPMPQWV